jgi:hypothetical protein
VNAVEIDDDRRFEENKGRLEMCGCAYGTGSYCSVLLSRGLLALVIEETNRSQTEVFWGSLHWRQQHVVSLCRGEGGGRRQQKIVDGSKNRSTFSFATQQNTV